MRIDVHSPASSDLIAWVQANGLDPASIPVPTTIFVEDGQVTVEEYVRDADGQFVVTDGFCERRTLTVPLVSADSPFGVVA